MKELDRSEEMLDVGIARGQAVELHKPDYVLHTGWCNFQVKVGAEIDPGTDSRQNILG